MKEIPNKIKNYLIKLVDDLDDPLPPEWEEKESIIDIIKEKFNNKKNIKKSKYITKEEAIDISSQDNNLIKHMYKEAIDNGYIYGIIELKDFYTTLVMYNNNIYWYIKVIDGKYGYKENKTNKIGYYDEYSNIRCLININTGKFIYIDKYFNTKDIRMITDEEYLNLIFKFN